MNENKTEKKKLKIDVVWKGVISLYFMFRIELKLINIYCLNSRKKTIFTKNVIKVSKFNLNKNQNYSINFSKICITKQYLKLIC